MMKMNIFFQYSLKLKYVYDENEFVFQQGLKQWWLYGKS